MEIEPLSLDYFSGGVPTGAYFQMTLEELRTISEGANDLPGIDRLRELVFIGLVSYFEAFCKDQFAAILNIEPSLLNRLKAAGQDTIIDAANLVLFKDEFPIRIGFVLAEKFDFGTAKKISSLYKAILNITPFSKDEMRQYDNVLRDRNLIVHHGGVYTLSHLQQAGLPAGDIRQNAYFNSVVLSQSDLLNQIDFISKIGGKIVKGSHKALVSYLEENDINLSDERRRAVEYVGDT